MIMYGLLPSGQCAPCQHFDFQVPIAIRNPCVHDVFAGEKRCAVSCRVTQTVREGVGHMLVSLARWIVCEKAHKCTCTEHRTAPWWGARSVSTLTATRTDNAPTTSHTHTDTNVERTPARTFSESTRLGSMGDGKRQPQWSHTCSNQARGMRAALHEAHRCAHTSHVIVCRDAIGRRSPLAGLSLLRDSTRLLSWGFPCPIA